MRIVHISGSPGSGKTTLGKRLSSLFEVRVIDTDDLLTELDEQQLFKFRDAGEHKKAQKFWRERFSLRLKDVAEKNQDANVLIFTGILNHDSPEGELLEMPFPNLEKYFLDIPAPKLLQQFYGRLAHLLQHDFQFAEEIASGKWTVESSVEYLAQSSREKNWHAEHGYALLSPDDVIARIETEIQTTSCQMCFEVATHVCAFCLQATYCSKNCQQGHWTEHKLQCKPV